MKSSLWSCNLSSLFSWLCTSHFYMLYDVALILHFGAKVTTYRFPCATFTFSLFTLFFSLSCLYPLPRTPLPFGTCACSQPIVCVIKGLQWSLSLVDLSGWLFFWFDEDNASKILRTRFTGKWKESLSTLIFCSQQPGRNSNGANPKQFFFYWIWFLWCKIFKERSV